MKTSIHNIIFEICLWHCVTFAVEAHSASTRQVMASSQEKMMRLFTPLSEINQRC